MCVDSCGDRNGHDTGAADHQARETKSQVCAMATYRSKELLQIDCYCRLVITSPVMVDLSQRGAVNWHTCVTIFCLLSLFFFFLGSRHFDPQNIV